jgi:hypothetical protein
MRSGRIASGQAVTQPARSSCVTAKACQPDLNAAMRA